MVRQGLLVWCYYRCYLFLGLLVWVLLVLSGVTCRCYLYSGVTCMGVTGFGQGLLVGITCIMGLLVYVLLVLVRGYL